MNEELNLRILTIFIDMLRTDLLNIYDNKLSETPVDFFFKNFGVDVFSNVWTPCPDTARSLSSFWSGTPCYENGCNKRGKYPSDFLLKGSFLDNLEKYGYQIKLLSNHSNRKELIFPRKYNKSEYFVQSLDEINELSNKSFVFIDIPDVHLVLDDLGYDKKSIPHAHRQLLDDLNLVFSKVDRHSFDKILFFSDHGHFFNNERSSDELFIGKARSNIFLAYWDKKTTEFSQKINFLSIADIPRLFILSNDLIHESNHTDSILVEDFKSFEISIQQTPDVWMYKTNSSELIFNKLQLVELFHSQNEVFIQALNKFPHLRLLLNEYAVYNKYLFMKTSKHESNSFYFNGRIRSVSLELIIKNFSSRLLFSIMPPALFRILKRIKNIYMDVN